MAINTVWFEYVHTFKTWADRGGGWVLTRVGVAGSGVSDGTSVAVGREVKVAVAEATWVSVGREVEVAADTEVGAWAAGEKGVSVGVANIVVGTTWMGAGLAAVGAGPLQLANIQLNITREINGP